MHAGATEVERARHRGAPVCREPLRGLPAGNGRDVYGLPECVTLGRGAVRVDPGVRQGDAISPLYDSDGGQDHCTRRHPRPGPGAPDRCAGAHPPARPAHHRAVPRSRGPPPGLRRWRSRTTAFIPPRKPLRASMRRWCGPCPTRWRWRWRKPCCLSEPAKAHARSPPRPWRSSGLGSARFDADFGGGRTPPCRAHPGHWRPPPDTLEVGAALHHVTLSGRQGECLHLIADGVQQHAAAVFARGVLHLCTGRLSATQLCRPDL